MTIQMRLDPEILQAARAIAEQRGITLSEYLRDLLRRDLEPGNPGARPSPDGEEGDSSSP